MPFETLVIPAKAGIQSVVGAFPMACGVDSRFRGNDRTWKRPCLANDTTTPGAAVSETTDRPLPLRQIIKPLPGFLREFS